MGKVIRRHKFAVIASAAIVTLLVGGLAVTGWLLVREREARQRAVAVQREQRRLATQLGDVVWMLLDRSFGKAEAVIREALPAHREVFGSESLEVAGWLAALAEVLQREGKFAEAEQPIRESLAILEKRFPGHWGIFYMRIVLGGVLLEEKKYIEAEPLLLSIHEQTIRDREQLLVPDSHSAKEATRRIVQLYMGWGKSEKAAEWQQKLDAFGTNDHRAGR